MAQVGLQVLDISDPSPHALEVTCVTSVSSVSVCPISAVLPDFQDWAMMLAAV